MSATNTCEGCDGSWKRASDLVQHHIKTTDLKCRAAANEITGRLRRSRFGPRRNLPSFANQYHRPQSSAIPDVEEMPQPFAGDFFGADYASADFPGFEPDSGEDSEDEEEDPDIGIEPHWEPERRQQSVRMDVDPEFQVDQNPLAPLMQKPTNPLLQHLPAHRDGIHIGSFGGHAGAPVPGAQPQPLRSSKSGFTQYQSGIPNSKENIWAPFVSKADWELARWAKLRGPGSTAFSELLDIEGVRVPTMNCSTYLHSMALLGQ